MIILTIFRSDMRQIKKRPTLRETIETNRASISFMAKLAGNESPVFDDTLLKPKRKPATASIHPTEAEILKTILKYLRLHPKVGLVVRVNSGTFVESNQDGTERYIQANNARGMSDLFGVLKTGQAFFIECKSKTGRVSPHQDEFLVKALQSNALAGVARDIESVDKILGFL
jgi:hypothetical protein